MRGEEVTLTGLVVDVKKMNEGYSVTLHVSSLPDKVERAVAPKAEKR